MTNLRTWIRRPAHRTGEEMDTERPTVRTMTSVRASLMIGTVTFVILLGLIGAGFYLVVLRPGGREAGVPLVANSAKGPLVYHTLIERNVFSTPLPPLGDRSVTFEYGVAVEVHKADVKTLEGIIAARQLRPKFQADIRKIIAGEEYSKLRGQELADVARAVRAMVNAELGQELVTEVVFPVWNVW